MKVCSFWRDDRREVGATVYLRFSCMLIDISEPAADVIALHEERHEVKACGGLDNTCNKRSISVPMSRMFSDAADDEIGQRIIELIRQDLTQLFKLNDVQCRFLYLNLTGQSSTSADKARRGIEQYIKERHTALPKPAGPYGHVGAVLPEPV